MNTRPKTIAAIAVATIAAGGVALTGCGSSEIDTSAAQEWIGQMGDIATDAADDLTALTECPTTSVAAFNKCMADGSYDLYMISARYENASDEGMKLPMPEPCKAFAQQTARIGERFADLALYAEKGIDAAADSATAANKVTSETETGTDLITKCGEALMA